MRITAVCVASLTLAFCSLASVSGEEPKAKPETKTTEHKIQDLSLKLPETWKTEKPENKLRLAQFVIPAVEGDDEGATLVVSAFTGGGIKENMSRWVGEFKDSVKVVTKTGESASGPYEFADLTGTYAGPSFRRRATPLENGRAITIVLKPKDKPYYYLKLAGPLKTVEAATKQLREAIGADAAKEKDFNREAE